MSCKITWVEKTIFRIIIIIVIIRPLSTRVGQLLRMSLQAVYSSFLRSPLPNSTHVHSLKSSCHLFPCLSQFIFPLVLPCKMVMTRSDEQIMLSYGIRWHIFPMVTISNYMLDCSLDLNNVDWHLYEMCSITPWFVLEKKREEERD